MTPEPPPELITQARAYIANREWKFAKTMPEMVRASG
jgi:hypothetical protein